MYCPNNAVKISPSTGRYEFDYDFCKGWGLCAKECPFHYIQMTLEKWSGFRVIIIKPRHLNLKKPSSLGGLFCLKLRFKVPWFKVQGWRLTVSYKVSFARSVTIWGRFKPCCVAGAHGEKRLWATAHSVGMLEQRLPNILNRAYIPLAVRTE